MAVIGGDEAAMLRDEAPAADADLPDTGVGLALERVLAPVFIRGLRYGTRASTAARVSSASSYQRASGNSRPSSFALTAAPWLWAVLLGLGGCAFTWTLTMFGRRTATPEGTAALSGFAQAVGYLVAGLGPFGTGVLHDLTGSWTVPVTVLMLAALLIGVLGTLVNRDRVLEDELRP